MAVYKRGKIWWFKFQAQGEEIRQSARTTSKREAQEAERSERRRIALDLHRGRTGKPTQYTYSEALGRWIEEGAPKSMESHARNTGPYLDDVPLHLVVPAAHSMKGAMLKKKLSPQTINRRLAVVRRILNVAYREWDWIQEPLGQKIKLLSEKGMAREFYLSREEADQLIAAVGSVEARKVIALAAYTGLRRGELLSLNAGNWQSPYIVLDSKTKGKRPRSVPVIEELHALVTPPFRVTPQQLREEFEGAREKMGRPDIRMHDLRHTYASWLAKDPRIPLTMLRDLLGHSSTTVTSKYSHLRSDTIGPVRDVLGRKPGTNL